MSRLYIPALLLPQRPASRRRPPAAARPTIRKSARHSLWCNAHCRLGALLSLFISAAALAQFPVAPLSQRPVPDVNVLGLLDKTGPNAHLWPMEAITSAGQQSELQRLGKALFWDMQVGGDGVQSCASCHYHAGADHRSIHQISPGLKSGDLDFDLNGSNNALRSSHFNAVNDQGAVVGIPVSEDRLLQLGWLPDDVDGTPGLRGAKDPLLLDVNDVISSQGIRAGTFFGLSGRRNDLVVFAPADGPFSQSFIEAAPGIPQTVRRVEPRATPSVLNAVFHLRNFWDGRADTFFNGRSPLGFRDPFAALPVWTSSGLRPEKLRIPFSSLASQAVGPVLSTFEMHYAPRRFADVGAKLAMSTPLAGQLISCSDSLLGAELDCHDEADGKRGLRGTYAERVKQIFHPRFWGDDSGNDVCLRVVGNGAGCCGGGFASLG
ncbi:MAG: cytochrome c peroxidase, partial [Myxococcota bacterium]